jgi:hypothetical protein
MCPQSSSTNFPSRPNASEDGAFWTPIVIDHDGVDHLAGGDFRHQIRVDRRGMCGIIVRDLVFEMRCAAPRLVVVKTSHGFTIALLGTLADFGVTIPV